MRMDQIISLAKLQGWRTGHDAHLHRRMPFCPKCLVREATIYQPNMRTDSDLGHRFFLYETIPGIVYKARFLTEIKKKNNQVIERLRTSKGFEDVVAALDFCT